MVRQFLTWWLRQLVELVPAGWRAGAGPRADVMLALLTPLDSPAATIEARWRSAVLGTFALPQDGPALGAVLRRQGGPPPSLTLPPGTVLERQLTLPILAEQAPGRVLEYEMDRFTPFRAEQVFWTWTIERRDPARERLHLRLRVVPKAWLQPLLAALGTAGVGVAALNAPSADGGTQRIPLHPAETTSGGRTRRMRVLAGTCAALALLAVALPFVTQSVARRGVERRIAALQPEVTQAERLRRDLAARSAGTDAFAAEEARAGQALAVIAAVTRALPDDTYLHELTLRDGKLTLDGQSLEAAGLIPALSAVPTLRNPAFAAPVTRLQGERADLFSIRADVGGRSR